MGVCMSVSIGAPRYQAGVLEPLSRCCPVSSNDGLMTHLARRLASAKRRARPADSTHQPWTLPLHSSSSRSASAPCHPNAVAVSVRVRRFACSRPSARICYLLTEFPRRAPSCRCRAPGCTCRSRAQALGHVPTQWDDQTLARDTESIVPVLQAGLAHRPAA